MKQLIIAVQINSSHDYCTAIREAEALEVLQCMTELGIDARLEYDDPPFKLIVPPMFNWTAFIRDYRELTKEQHLC